MLGGIVVDGCEKLEWLRMDVIKRMVEDMVK